MSTEELRSSLKAAIAVGPNNMQPFIMDSIVLENLQVVPIQAYMYPGVYVGIVLYMMTP